MLEPSASTEDDALTVDELLDATETLRATTAAARGDRPKSHNESTLVTTGDRFLYITRRSFTAIHHDAIDTIEVTRHPADRPFTSLATQLLGLATLSTGVGAFATLTDHVPFEFMGTACILGAALLALLAIALYTVTADYYESMTVTTNTSTHTFTTATRNKFREFSRLAAQSE